MHFCIFGGEVIERNINLKYSVDKVKLEFEVVKRSVLEEFYSFLKSDSKYLYEHYQSTKVTNCKENFMFDFCGNTLYLGVEPNWRKDFNKYDTSVVIEYNPNKLLLSDYPLFWWLLKHNKACIKVMKFDIAIDIPLPYSSLKMLKRDKREYYNIHGTNEVETFYLGKKKESDCPVKFYNKAKEQKINVDWSRLEFTIKKFNSLDGNLKSFTDSVKVPTVFRCCSQYNETFMALKGSSKIILNAILEDVNLLYELDSRTRKKYEQMLHDCYSSLDISVQAMYRAFLKYVERI